MPIAKVDITSVLNKWLARVIVSSMSSQARWESLCFRVNFKAEISTRVNFSQTAGSAQGRNNAESKTEVTAWITTGHEEPMVATLT
jgi:hypothetical protein